MNSLKVKDQDHLYRDVNTGAIINTDRSSFAKYKASRNKQRSMEHELDYVKGELSELKTLLKQLIESNGTSHSK